MERAQLFLFFSLQRYDLCFQCLRLSYCVFCLLSNFSICNSVQTPTLTVLPPLGVCLWQVDLRLFSVERAFASEKELGVSFHSIKLLSDLVWQGLDKTHSLTLSVLNLTIRET